MAALGTEEEAGATMSPCVCRLSFEFYQKALGAQPQLLPSASGAGDPELTEAHLGAIGFATTWSSLPRSKHLLASKF